MKSAYKLLAVTGIAFIAAIGYEFWKTKQAGKTIGPQALQRPLSSSAPLQGAQNNPTPSVSPRPTSSGVTPSVDIPGLPQFTLSPTYRVDALFGKGDILQKVPTGVFYNSSPYYGAA